jgi:hypothetical protein
VIVTYNGNEQGARETGAPALQLDVGDSASFAAFAARVADELRTRCRCSPTAARSTTSPATRRASRRPATPPTRR